MGSEWIQMPFSTAVLVNPGAPLIRGREYPFVDMTAINPSSRSAFASESRVFDGGGSRFFAGDTLMARITPCLENGKIARFCGAEGIENVVVGSTFRSSFADDYGTKLLDGPLAGLNARSVVVIDADGKVVARTSGEISMEQFDQLVAKAQSGKN